MRGKAFLVGSGPGGLGLLTFRAREVIDSADVILYDQLPGDEILSTLPPDAERIDCGKFGGDHTLEQREIEEIMIARVMEGKRVVRLKGGDPFLFGRGGEELEALREHGVPVEVVPGVTSAIAVPECVGIPVTHRRYASAVTVITGHEDPTKPESALDWEVLARLRGTIVILMGVKNLPGIAAALMEHGKNPLTPVAVIERGLRTDQRVTVGPLGEIAEIAKERGVSPPAVIVIGDVVHLYDESHLPR
ncbi:MAG: uroporphyrinogen-III C-methyltransferase [Methanomicrobiaceae archaeon]|nr:uroporphyrinogen-III C-methyltransferase [Methanomicrobiaceae archaeon]MDD5420145.1 uroporphyrinogen-III C-methyltransferase [Methanomicrobiaceae archaeon]